MKVSKNKSEIITDNEIKEKVISEEDLISPNFEYEEDIIDYAENTFSLIDSFEAFISAKDKKPYIIYQNKNNYVLEVLKILKNKYQLITQIEGHNGKLTSMKYYYNKNKNIEYLISADYNGKIIITNITEEYMKESTLNIHYDNGKIACCLMLFQIDSDLDIKNGLILISNKNSGGAREIPILEYILNENGKLIFSDNLPISSGNTSYIIHWLNKKNKKDYIIDIGYKKIDIFNLTEKGVYASLHPPLIMETWYHCGLVYNDDENNRELLYITSIQSNVFVFDLYSRENIKVINTSGKLDRLYNIIQWNSNYILVSNATTPDIKIIDIKQQKCVGNNYFRHEDDFRCIKKIKHPKFGYCVLTGSDDYSIKLFKPKSI